MAQTAVPPALWGWSANDSACVGAGSAVSQPANTDTASECSNISTVDITEAVDMPAVVPRSKALKINVDQLFCMFVDLIAPHRMLQARREGCLFDSQSKSGAGTIGANHPYKVFRSLIATYLSSIDKRGFCLKSIVREALNKLAKHLMLEDTTGDDGTKIDNAVPGMNIDGKIPLRVQAMNFCHYFADLRMKKRNCQSGLRLDPVVKSLVDLMQTTAEEEKDSFKKEDADDSPLSLVLVDQEQERVTRSPKPQSPKQKRILLRRDTTPSPKQFRINGKNAVTVADNVADEPYAPFDDNDAWADAPVGAKFIFDKVENEPRMFTRHGRQSPIGIVEQDGFICGIFEPLESGYETTNKLIRWVSEITISEYCELTDALKAGNEKNSRKRTARTDDVKVVKEKVGTKSSCKRPSGMCASTSLLKRPSVASSDKPLPTASSVPSLTSTQETQLKALVDEVFKSEVAKHVPKTKFKMAPKNINSRLYHTLRPKLLNAGLPLEYLHIKVAEMEKKLK